MQITYGKQQPLNVFYVHDEITSATPQTDEDYAVKKIIRAVIANEAKPYAERMAALEKAVRTELREAFNLAITQVIGEEF